MDITLGIRNLRSSVPKIEYKCLNCGKKIENPEGPYGKRFCSEDCKLAYFK